MSSILQKATVILLSINLFTATAPQQGHANAPIWANEALSSIIAEGLKNNQELQSISARVKSIKAQAHYAGSLADPRIGIAIANLPTDSFAFDEQAMTQKQLFIAQKFPWFGKLSLKSQQVTLEAERQEAVLASKRRELAKDIASAYYELGFIAKSQEINQRLFQMIDQTLTIAETKYTTGRGRQQDVFQAQVELSKLEDEKIILEKNRRIKEDRMNALLNRNRFAPIEPPTGLKPFNMTLDAAVLSEQALKQNSMIRVKQVETDIAKTKIELAQKDYWPDMDIKLSYGQRDDVNGNDLPDFFSASVAMNIPLWQGNRQGKMVAASDAGNLSAMKSYKNLVDSLPHQVDALATEIITTRKSYQLYKDTLIFQAQQWARSSLSDYEVGKVEFNTMINARVRLLRFELQAEKYLFEMHKKRAVLEEILGGPVQIESVSNTATLKR